MRDFQSFSRKQHVARVTDLLNERQKSDSSQRTYCADQLAQRAKLIAEKHHLPIEHIRDFTELLSVVPITAIAGYLLSKTKITTQHRIEAHHEIVSAHACDDEGHHAVACPCTWKHTHIEGNKLHPFGGDPKSGNLTVEADQITYHCTKCKYKFRMHDLNMTLRGLVGQHPYFFHTQNFDHALTRAQQTEIVTKLLKCWNVHRRLFDFEEATRIIEAQFISQKRNGQTYVKKHLFLEYHTLMSLVSEAFQGASQVSARKGYGYITRGGNKALFDPFGFAPATRPNHQYRNRVYVASPHPSITNLLNNYGYDAVPWKNYTGKQILRNTYHLLPLNAHGQLDRSVLDHMRRDLRVPFLVFRPAEGEGDLTLLHGITARGQSVPLKPRDFNAQKPVAHLTPHILSFDQVLAYYDFSKNPYSNIEYLYPADAAVKPFFETIGKFHTDTANMLSGFPETTRLKDHNIAEYFVHSLSLERMPEIEALYTQLDTFVLDHSGYLIEHANDFNNDQPVTLTELVKKALAWEQEHTAKPAVFTKQQNKLLYLVKKWLFSQETARRGYFNRNLEDYPKKVLVDTSPTGSGKSYYAPQIAKLWKNRHDGGRTIIVTKSPYNATPSVKESFTFIVGRSRENRYYDVNPGTRRVRPVTEDARFALNAKCEKLDEINAHAVDMEYDTAVKKVCNKNHCPLFQICEARRLVGLSHDYAADRAHDLVMSETTFTHSQQFCSKKDLVIFDDTDIEHAETILQGKTKYLVESTVDDIKPLWDHVNSKDEKYLTALIREKLEDAARGNISKRVKYRLERLLAALTGEWSMDRGLKAITVKHTPRLHVPSVTNAIYLCATTSHDDVHTYFHDFEMIENVSRNKQGDRPHTVLVEHENYVGNWATNTNMIHYLVEDLHRIMRRHCHDVEWGMVTHKFNIDYLTDKIHLRDLIPRFGYFTLFKKTPHYSKYRDYYPIFVKQTKAYLEFEAYWKNVTLAYIDHGVAPKITHNYEKRCWEDIRNWVAGYRALYAMRRRFTYISMGNVKSNNAFHERGIQHVVQLGDARVSQEAVQMKKIEPIGDVFVDSGMCYQHFPLHSPEAMCNARLSQQVIGRVRANRYQDTCYHYLVGVTVPYVVVDESIAGCPKEEDTLASRYTAKIRHHIENYWYDRSLSKLCPRDRLIRKQTGEFIEKRLDLLLNKADDDYVWDCWNTHFMLERNQFQGTKQQWSFLKSVIIQDLARRINMSVHDICKALLELGMPYDELTSLKIYRDWFRCDDDKEELHQHYMTIASNPHKQRLLEMYGDLYAHLKERWRSRGKPPPDIIAVA